MERFPRLFILAAIGYLLLGVGVGLGVSLGGMDPISGRFVHAHLNLAGFMAMFIYGVAYHILPRFNAAPLKHPGLVGVHFYLVNAGLLGMTGAAFADGVYGGGAAHTVFGLSAMLETAGILLFAYNIIPVLIGGGQAMSAAFPPPQKKAPEPPAITPVSKVAEIIEKWPHLIDLLVASGFKTLANPSARATFARATTIAQACGIHRVNADELVAKLNAALRGEKVTAVKAAPAPEKTATEAMAKGKAIKRGETPSADTLIGSLLEAYPETRPVFEKHYGEGCFSCPGQSFETIAQTAGMHGMKTETVLDEINNAIGSAKKGA